MRRRAGEGWRRQGVQGLGGDRALTSGGGYNDSEYLGQNFLELVI